MNQNAPDSTTIEIRDEEYTITREDVIQAFENTEQPNDRISHLVVVDDEAKGSKDVFRNIEGTPDSFHTRHSDSTFEALGFNVRNESSWRETVREEIVRYHKINDTLEFELQDFAEFSESTIQERFPSNQSGEAGLRRTLQQLRDRDEIEFLGNGNYRINKTTFQPYFDGPTVYLAPGANEVSKQHFERSARKGILRETYQDFTDLDLGAEARVWGGFPDHQSDVWEGVESGDYVFFYRGDGYYGDAARVVDTELNREFAEHLWPDYVGGPDSDKDQESEWIHLVYLQDIEQVEIPSEELHSLVEFDQEYPSQTSLMDTSAVESIRDQYGSIEEFIDAHVRNNQVWVEKTQMEDREYKQEGELQLGSAIMAPSRDKGGGKRYEELREADVGDIVLHLLQDQHQFVGVSVIDSELVDDFSGPPDNRWTKEQQEQGGYLRWLSKYEGIEPHIHVYDHLLENPEYEEDLQEIRENSEKIFYNKRLSLNEGHYFTQCPDDLVEVLADESQHLRELLDERGYQLENSNDQPREDFENKDHPLVKHFRQSGCQVYVAPAPPDYWLSVLRNRLMAFSSDHSDIVTDIHSGDIILCYANSDGNTARLADYGGRLIAAGIVDSELASVSGKEFETIEAEPPTDSYDRFLTFERLFTTTDTDQWDGPIEDLSTDHIERSLESLLEAGIPIGGINEECERVADKEFIYQGSPSELSDPDPYGRREAVIDMFADSIVEVPPYSIFQDFNGKIPPSIFTDDLYFPENQGIITPEKLSKQISSALRSGKHIIFTGPPGTGKTEVAERVAQHLADNHGYLYNNWKLTTATADWSTFNTVGGYMPSPEKDSDRLDFHPGVLLNRFKDKREDVPTNEPTVIDEINRADIDKAFGQLFTTLSGQTVTIPYVLEDNPDEEIQISIAIDTELPIDPHQFLVPNSWRLFGTMNTFDKTSLHELSYAFMRRFSFIRIGVPTIPDDENELVDLIGEFAKYWEIENPDRTLLLQVGQVWRETNMTVEERSIGPAIVRDILMYATEHDDADELEDRLTEAVISYIFPQLEGVPEREEIVRQIGNNTGVNRDEIDRAAKDMLGISAFDSD